MTGNPVRQLGTYKPPAMPERKIRALTADYFIAGKVAVKGETYTVAADDARGLIAQRRAEYAE